MIPPSLDPTSEQGACMRLEVLLDKAEDEVVPLEKMSAVYLPSTPEMDAMKEGLKHFSEKSLLMMKALDDISRIHPFIAVAVTAFKIVVNLELKRRQNDYKVIALHVQMRDTMSILLQLRNIGDQPELQPDGTCMEGRMQRVMMHLTDNIKVCGNVCDKYSKKSTLAKILVSPLYEQRLAGCSAAFAERRRELTLAMGLHITTEIDAATRMLRGLNDTARSIDHKTTMLLLFRKLDSTRDRELMTFIDKKGGLQKCINDDEILRELQCKISESEHSVFEEPPEAAQCGDALQPTRETLFKLKEEIREDMEAALDENMLQFERKMRVQNQQLEDVVRTESSRIIGVVQGGSHHYLIDPDLKELWRAMGWRASVKARHFVLCLHDYFSDNYGKDSIALGTPMTPSMSRVPSYFSHTATDDDRWALESIRIASVQHVLEGIDRNCSGFISIREANAFASARPLDWSLPDWIAFWGVAWPHSVKQYRRKILVLVQRMYKALDECLPVNRCILDGYLSHVTFRYLELLLRGTHFSEETTTSTSKIEAHLKKKEQKLQENLESMEYNLDAGNTVRLVASDSHIERYIYPLLSLLFNHHLKIFRLSKTHVLDTRELVVATSALATLCTMLYHRMRDLQSIFKQMPDPGGNFHKFAFGMFDFLSKPTSFVDRNIYSLKYFDEEDDVEDVVRFEHHLTPTAGLKIPATPFTSIGSNQSVEVDALTILRYQVRDEFDYSSYERAAESASYCSPALPHPIAGNWTGFRSFNQSASSMDSRLRNGEGMVTFSFNCSQDDRRFQGMGESHYGLSTVRSGCITDEFNVTFCNEYLETAHSDQHAGFKITWCGQYCEESNTISGNWLYEGKTDTPGGTFLLKRASPHHLRFWVSTGNIVLDRWRYACAAVLDQVCWRLWSTRAFKDRTQQKMRFIDINVRRGIMRRRRNHQLVTLAELDEVDRLELCIVPADGRYFLSIADSIVRQITFHQHVQVNCDSCSLDIIGPRFMCLECVTPGCNQQIDMCLSCFNSRKEPSNRLLKHRDAHDIVYLGYLLHDKDKAHTIQSSRRATEHAKATMEIEQGAEPKCCQCLEVISFPYWICSSSCKSDIAFCDPCVMTSIKPFKPYHSSSIHEHPLVRIQKPLSTSDVLPIESRLTALEGKTASMDVKLTHVADMVSQILALVQPR